MKNKYTEKHLLTTEASVEALIIQRWIADLGYGDKDILHKATIKPAEIALGSKKMSYAPDFILNVKGKPSVIIDAKAPSENIMDWVGQCVSYCATINRTFKNDNPVRYFVISSGIKTAIFALDQGEPVLELSFSDFKAGGKKFTAAIDLLNPSAVENTQKTKAEVHEFERFGVETVNSIFAWCHQHIYKKDNLSQAAGFEQFVKLIFLKLLSDRSIRDKYPHLIGASAFSVPSDDVKFSVAWIEAREDDDPNPIDSVQFRTLLSNLENEIRTNKKKRIFPEGTRITLRADTIKEVVRRLERAYLFGIDADLNGRLFETFLSATMRGKDLGQFFTPRSVAKLGTLLANLKVTKSEYDLVLDGCCGTGGFLIDALADMWGKVDSNNSLSDSEKATLRKAIAEKAIIGVDIAQEPNLARLARMNMYLHGDGGTAIFEADFLDKDLADPIHSSAEVRAETEQLKAMLQKEKGVVDVVLTNPPFAKVYEKKTQNDKRILTKYEVLGSEDKLRSSVMFFERYHDVLKPGGRLVSIIDDGILSGRSYAEFRKFLRDKYLIRGIVSLPGDAFQRSQARVKTSFLMLEKQDSDNPKEQGPVFRYACRWVGIDDPKRQRTLPRDIEIRNSAVEEVIMVADLFRRFTAGEAMPEKHIIPADHIKDRLDAKNFEPIGRMEASWNYNGLSVLKVSDMIDIVEPGEDGGYDADSDEPPYYLVVGYDGYARAGDQVQLGDEAKIQKLMSVRSGQIVLSHINAVHGSVCLVPDELDGALVTTEFSVFDVKPGYDPRVVWATLRSPEIRSEFLIRASGAGRTRVRWDVIRDITVPVPDAALQSEVTDALVLAEARIREAQQLRAQAIERLQGRLLLETPAATETLQAFKPPR